MQEPLGRGHEWVTGHVLTTLSIFEENGPKHHYFSPVWTFGDTAEKFLISHAEFKDRANYTYYVSYPPLCFLLPYYCFKLTGITPTILAIRYFGIILHFFCAFLILRLVYAFFDKSLSKHIYLPGYLAGAIYIFSAGNLWFHSNIYFADTLVQLFLLWALFLLVKVFKNEELILNAPFLILIGLVNFLGVYTEWLQVFFAFATCLLLFILTFRNKKNVFLLLVIISSTLLSLSLTVFQYSSICGIKELEKISIEKYNQRSGRTEISEPGTRISDKTSFLKLTQNYEDHYSTILDLLFFSLLCIGFIFLLTQKKTETLKANKHIIYPVTILFLSVLMHILIFYNFNVLHDFSTLKSSTLFSLAIGISFAAFCNYTNKFSLKVKWTCNLLFLGLAVYYISESINRYYRNNNSNQVTYSYASYGEAVRRYAKTEDIVFARYGDPVSSYYAHKNFVQVNNIREAIDFLQRIKYENGIFVDSDGDVSGIIKKVVRINMKGDSVELVTNYHPTSYTNPIQFPCRK